MLAWLTSNLVNIILIAVLAFAVMLVIRGMVKDKKAGKSSCGGNCASCGCNCTACKGCADCSTHKEVC